MELLSQVFGTRRTKTYPPRFSCHSSEVSRLPCCCRQQIGLQFSRSMAVRLPQPHQDLAGRLGMFLQPAATPACECLEQRCDPAVATNG
eukprot:2117655-Amphidinium_carterae.1